jgi:hypothetical protein
MGWADDMHDAGYTSEHGGLMDRNCYSNSSSSTTRVNSSKPIGNNSGKSWTNGARYKVASLYASGDDIESIASVFSRTPYAIAWQLFNMDKISAYEREQHSK